ncbi:MAG: chromosome segregation protein SMC [Candidatus Latescibacteria bacterium]|nr:chromosome segregation protein SMC [Candidatus Latescibacterota bacterium]
MYLSRLTAFGFKSFAQKVDIDFRGGITAVVGPNGCGKTNIVDAIRWALGEQRPGAMRSSRMEDVIFTGSRNRKPLGMAEVSLTIANDKKILPVDFSEVTVTRRLFRSGESDYLLNKIPCRLMDIHTLFMDTGLGAHAYSVIEQGMVDAIISDKTEERRHLFEEAAGITRYKVRRKSAWNKLLSIQADLQRIDDIVGEVERQVHSLQRQVRKARLYKTYSDQVRDMEILLGRFRYFELAQKARPVLEEIRFLKEDVEVGTSDQARAEARLEGVRAELAEQEQALSAINAELGRHQATAHAKDRDVSVARESIRGIEAFLERAGRGRSELLLRLETVSKGQGDADTERERVRQDQAGAEQGLTSAETDLKQARGLLDEWRARADAEKARLIGLLQGRGDRAGKLERARAERESLLGRLSEGEAERQVTAARAEVAAKSAEMAAADIRTTEERAAQALAEKDRLTEALTQTRERIRALVDEQNEVRRRIEGNRARVHLLERLREGFEGYSQGVRALAVDSPHAAHIRGVMADLIDVDEPYARAVETALGRSLEALVVSGTAEAEAAIRYLREGGKGTAAFWPLDRISGTDEGSAWEIPLTDGVIGRASDLVRCDGAFAGLVWRLLGRTLVVRDTASALALAPTFAGAQIDLVTLEGDFLAASGLMAGGRSGQEQEHGLIGRRQQIEALSREVEADDLRLKALSEQVVAGEDAAKDLSGHAEEADRQIVELRNRIAELERERYNGEADARRLNERLAALSEEEGRIRARAEELRAQIEAQEEELRRMDAERAELERLAEEHAAALREEEEELRSRQEGANTLRMKAASLRAREEELRREALRLETERGSLQRQLEGTDAEVADAARRKETIEAQRARDEGEMKVLHETLSEIERRRSVQVERHQELVLAARGLEEDIRGRGRVLNERRERLHGLELSLQELKAKADALRDRLLDSHRVDVKEAGPPPDEGGFSADVIEKRIYEFQERMRRLGAVNMAALEDYDVQKERYEFLTRQRNDLLEAEETLKKTIAKIDRTARSRFTETFEKIRENFRKTFVAFFEGGEADLSMEPDQDPLEAPIHITARPLGKRLQHINLLSGGERALTAIAMLFAIYLVKPSPFCILDEVDAPLDDANINRFTRVLKTFAQDTQFIVVTHNKKTMEAAESLHGVTMEEPGVSKLVSVRIGRNGRSDANGDEHAAQTAGAAEAASD